MQFTKLNTFITFPEIAFVTDVQGKDQIYGNQVFTFKYEVY